MIFQSKIIIVAIVGLIVVGAAGTVAYRAVEQRRVESVAPPTSPEVVPAPKTAMSPKETYLKMVAEVANVRTSDDYEAFMLKYGSKVQIARIAENRVAINALTEAQRGQAMVIVKSLWPLSNDITTIQESINGSTATLSVFIKINLKLTVTLVLENNQWKLEQVSWKQP